MSHDIGRNVPHVFRVMARESGSGFKKDFLRRVRQARVDAGYTQESIALAMQLGSPVEAQGKYKQYEVRSFMPHSLIPAFCALTNKSVEWLFTGREKVVSRAVGKKRAA